MKKKRLLAWALTAVMAVGAGPVTALAAESASDTPANPLQPDPVTVTQDGTELAELSKTAESMGNGKYEVTLSVTAKQKIETQPIEIVLVLDSSGSMAWCTGDVELHDHKKLNCWTTCGKEEHIHHNGKHNHCYDQDGNLICEKEKHTHTDACYTCGKVEHEHSGGTECSQVTADNPSRMDIVKEKAKAMVAQLKQKAADTGVDIKVAVVDFDSKVQKDSSCGLTPVTDDTTINGVIDKMKAEGSTFPDAGLNKADKILQGKDANPAAKKVVIMLADGDADNDVDKNAMYKKADEMKKYAEIFTIGFATDAAMLKKIATDNGANGHYATADNEMDLSGIFTNIVNGLQALISDPMGDLVTLDKNSVNVSLTDGMKTVTDNKIEWTRAEGLQTGQTVTITYTVSLNEDEILQKDVGTHEVLLNGDARLNYSCGNKSGSEKFHVPKTTVGVGQIVYEYYLDGDLKGTKPMNKVIVTDDMMVMGNTMNAEKYVGENAELDQLTMAKNGGLEKGIQINDSFPLTPDIITVRHYYKTKQTPATAYYKVEHYKGDLKGVYTLADTDPSTGLSSDKAGTTATAAEKNYEGYCLNPQAEGYLASAELTAGNTESNPLVLKLFYDLDENHDKIPDKYQKKVTFKVVNGTWSDGTTADKITYVTLLDANGNQSETGTGTLTAPTGMKANTNYGNGAWDTTPPTTVSGTADAAYTYSFSKIFSGGGGGGGSHSHRNTTKTEPKQEEVLNKEDHFQYVQGYPDATVRPDANITRAEATVIFFRLLTDSVREKYLDTENSFTDVNAADWFNLGISTMENGGFVNGYKDGSFRPNGYITRAELATIISNFDDLEPVEESKFPDAAGHWAEAYINSAAEKGWLSGYADGLFRPNQLITRAETMSMINRVLERSVDADGLHADAKQWQDNPVGKWYYYAVLEATNPHEYERKDTTDVERWTAITAEKIWEN